MEPHAVFWYDTPCVSPSQPCAPRRAGRAFDDILEQALEMLRRRGHVSYRALKVQFQLDDDLLTLLRDEIGL
jgi:hypothetical protein